MIIRKIEIVSLKVVVLSMIKIMNNVMNKWNLEGEFIIYARKFYENFVYVNYSDILNFS